jgi:hypothetical protein
MLEIERRPSLELRRLMRADNEPISAEILIRLGRADEVLPTLRLYGDGFIILGVLEKTVRMYTNWVKRLSDHFCMYNSVTSGSF